MKKKIELALVQAWQKQSSWLRLLSPLAKVYELASRHQKRLYELGKRPVYRAYVPVLVIGNITVGGSGKTPLIIALVQYLCAKGIQVGVISRGYGVYQDKPMLVTAASLPSDVGDEPCLIAQSCTDVAVAVCPNRGRAIELLLQQYPDTKLIISDDGLQHYALYHDEAWIVVDVERGFGNGKLLPQGFLREPISRLVGANLVYHYPNSVDAKESKHPAVMYLQPDQLVAMVLDNTLAVPSLGRRVYALTGIGYPMRFFNTLKSLGFEVCERPLPDHYAFTVADVAKLQDLPIIVTAKDAVKIRQLITPDNRHLFANLWVLPVTAVLSDGVKQMADRFCEQFELNQSKNSIF